MNKFKKLIGCIVLSMSLVVGLIPTLSVDAIDVIDSLDVVSGKTTKECSDNYVTNDIVINLPEDTKAQNVYLYSFDIKEDSFVNVSINTDANVSSGNNYTHIAGSFELYSDRALSNKVNSKNSSVDAFNNYKLLNNLKKGTYYIKLTASAYSEDYTGDRNAQITVQSVPINSIISFNYKVKGNDVETVITNNVEDWAPYLWVQVSKSIEKYIASGNIYTSGEKKVWDKSKFEGWYNGNNLYIAVNDKLDTAGSTDGNVVGFIKEIDITSPTITGVSNGKTYKKSVRVKFKDNSGIKSAKLDGKSIKSGYKVSKKGSHKLVVVDKVGNTTTVKFKIKK